MVWKETVKHLNVILTQVFVVTFQSKVMVVLCPVNLDYVSQMPVALL